MASAFVVEFGFLSRMYELSLFCSWPAWQVAPEGHVLHVVDPSFSVYSDDEHTVHSSRPSRLAYEPAGHGRHVWAPSLSA